MVSKAPGDLSKEYRDSLQSEFLRVHTKLDKVEGKLDDLRASELSQMKADIAVLQIKAGVWGLIGGAIPAVVVLIYMAVSK